MKLLLVVLVAFLAGNVYSQSVKSEDVKYTYVKLPTNPVQSKVSNYQSMITSSSEAENAKILSQFEKDKALAEADYQRELAEYPAKAKTADEKYEKEMAAYNAKSTATKVIEKQLLNENSKPVKEYVAQPYRRTIAQPILKSSYDYPSLAATYLKLDGFNKSAENAIFYLVNIQGFEHAQPMIKSETKKEVSRVNNVTTTNDVTYYYVEFTYRNPMSVRVTSPTNQELLFVAPTELSEYKTYKSTSAKSYPSSDFSALLKTTEESILRDNLTFINHLVNDKIGYENTARETSLDYIKSKNEEYTDFNEAYNNAMAGLKTLVSNEVSAKQKLTSAVEKWNELLKESDIENKKARIDKDATIAIYFNLLECYFALRNSVDAEKIISELEKIDISNREKKLKEKYVSLYQDLTIRKTANGI